MRDHEHIEQMDAEIRRLAEQDQIREDARRYEEIADMRRQADAARDTREGQR